MENLGQSAVETGLEVVSAQACPIKKALPVALPLLAVAGLVLLGAKVLKRNKAKKVTAQEAKEVNPEA